MNKRKGSVYLQITKAQKCYFLWGGGNSLIINEKNFTRRFLRSLVNDGVRFGSGVCLFTFPSLFCKAILQYFKRITGKTAAMTLPQQPILRIIVLLLKYFNSTNRVKTGLFVIAVSTFLRIFALQFVQVTVIYKLIS